jgi:ATP-binding cassette subfamily B protein
MADTKDEAPPSRKLGNLRMVWDAAIRYPGKIVGAGLALLVAALGTLAIPDGFRRVIDKGFAAGDGNVGEHFYYLFGIVLILALATATRFYFVAWLGERVVADIRTAVHRNLLRLEPRFFEENRPSEIASRLTADTAVIELVVGQTISVALRNLVMGVGGVIYLFTLAPKLTAFLLLGIPVIILPIVFLAKRLRDVSRYSQDRIADVGAIVAETLGAMKIVQAFGQETRESGRFSSAVENAFGTARRRILLRAGMTAIVIGLMFGSITLVMWQAAIDVQEGQLSGGTVAAFVFTGAIVAGAFGALTRYGANCCGAPARPAASPSCWRRCRRSRRPLTPCRCPSPRAVRSRSRTSPSAIPPAPMRVRSAASASTSGPVRRLRSSARPARARPPSSSSPSASTIRKRHGAPRRRRHPHRRSRRHPQPHRRGPPGNGDLRRFGA